MRKKQSMYHTFKTDIFGKLAVNGQEVPVVSIIDGHLVINDECCDLRTVKERYNPETRELAPSAVERILTAESILTTHYGKCGEDTNTLFDFITVDCSGGNDFDPAAKPVKDLLCFDGLYVPLAKLVAVGYIAHDEAEMVSIEGIRYIRYRAAMQSASENRQCKLTMSTYKWADFARTISADARYLNEATQTAQKSIARQGLGKTNGNVIEDFRFSYDLLPDLEVDLSFAAKCFYDAENEIRTETINTNRNANDGAGFISPAKARELANRLELNYLPSCFQVRFGQIKGLLVTFDFHKYTDGAISEDILFTASQWKSDFDQSKAQFLVANVSKPPRKYAELNYQLLTCLNQQLTFEDVRPYVENVKAYMDKALTSPECALQFLGMLSDISSLDSDSGDKDEYACVDRVSAVIAANPQLAMNVRWVKQSIKRKINLVTKKMLGGKIPVPHSAVSIMIPDPVGYFNRLRVDESGNYSLAMGNLVVPPHKQAKELRVYEFYHNGYQGAILAARNPLTHTAQIRKLDCVSHESSSQWYRHLGQVTIFNIHDETPLGMAGADFDGDMCVTSRLFVDKFQQADYIIYNNNDTGSKQAKVVLTEEALQQGIRANLQTNMLGLICNINTRTLELLNDEKSLCKFVNLAGYTENRSFGSTKVPQMPYYPKFKDMDTARAYMEIDASACYSITESLKGASCLDISEVERIMDAVRPVFRAYCHDIAGNIRALKDGGISQDDFDNALENIINISDEKLRAISTYRAAVAYSSYVLSLENGYGSQSFPFLVALDGMVALLNDVRAVDYHEIRLHRNIPREISHLLHDAGHIIVYNRKCRLPENVHPGKIYFGDVSLPNGSYELHKSLKGDISLIVPKAAKHKLNHVPYSDDARFSLKVSYKASELLPEHQNGEYVTGLMSGGTVTFRETTMNGNLQYGVYVDGLWCGTLFDDMSNAWVMRKGIARSLADKQYSLVAVPRTGIKTNSNSFTTGNGNPRTANVLTFVLATSAMQEVAA